jgi:hypothetical protein
MEVAAIIASGTVNFILNLSLMATSKQFKSHTRMDLDVRNSPNLLADIALRLRGSKSSISVTTEIAEHSEM